MNLTVRFLGLELLAVEISTDQAAEDDLARDLSGGTLGSDRIEVGRTDLFMGFTNGRECDE